ncbi:MAG: hypothetical protein ACI399_05550 [Candidatus Cryptobacteroides sp.]
MNRIDAILVSLAVLVTATGQSAATESRAAGGATRGKSVAGQCAASTAQQEKASERQRGGRIEDRIEGYGGEVFTILRPDAGRMESVRAEDFGLSTEAEDNSEALRKAVEYLRTHPGTKLVVGKGTYRFSPFDPARSLWLNTIELRGLKDIFIEAEGAEFIFARMGNFIGIYDCDCLQINGLSVDWDREADPVDDVFRVVNADPENKTLEMEFFLRDEVDPGMRIQAITQCDPQSFTFGAKGSSKEWYAYINPAGIKSIEKAGPNVLRMTHDGAASNFADGETYILRHHVYDGTVFHLAGNSRNVTFSGMNIYGSPGMALIVGGKASHFQMLDCCIGVDPALEARHKVSLGADAIHIANSCGKFRISGCDISRQGDDAINVHDGLGYIREVRGDTVEMYASSMELGAGDTLSFKDSLFFETGRTAVIKSSTRSGNVSTVTLDRDVSEYVDAGFIAWNTGVDSGSYVITDNNFHENRARGLLLQSSRGICSGNRFYRIQGMAIRIVMDIIPHLWQEGTGVDGLLVSGNVFEECDYGAWGKQIEISTSINGKTAGEKVFRNIEISRNLFLNPQSILLDADNVEKLDFIRNKAEGMGELSPVRLGNTSESVRVGKNRFRK